MSQYDRVTADTNAYYRWLDEPSDAEREYLSDLAADMENDAAKADKE